MSETIQNINTLLKIFKTNYLDNRNVGLRRFSQMSSISRTRLQRLFEGFVQPTQEEIIKISRAMELIELEAEKKMELKQKKEFKNQLDKLLKENLTK